MGKIVGNSVLLVLVSICTIVQADITLKIFDTNHVPLNQAGAGHPFVIEISVSDVSTIGQTPKIEGIENFDVKNSGIRITSINGKTTGKYSFELRIDEPGTYTLGPATIVDRGSQLRSNIVRVVVGQEQIEQPNALRSKKQEAPILLRLICDTKRAVVGEQLKCKLRFYYTNPAISLRQFIEQESKDIRRNKAEGPFAGNENINGIDYNYVEWEWDVFPTKAGTITIPAYGANYELEKDRDDMWGGLGRLFGSHIETKRVYSNAISLRVDPLPASDKRMDAIGEYSLLELSAQPAMAKQGEGIVVAVEVIGYGDPDGVKFAGLQGVPPELKHYESKQSFIAGDQGEPGRKRFEFIVQGLKTGTWEIPAQSLQFYNTRLRKFDALTSAPLSVTIMPGAPTNQPVSVQKKEAQLNDTRSLVIAGLHTVGRAPMTPSFHLPWWLFFVLVFLPFFILLYRMVLQALQKTRRSSYSARRAQNAFTWAIKQIALAQKKNDTSQLYRIFIQAFADRWQQPIATITEQHSIERLKSAGMNQQELHEWQQFLSSITHQAFGAQKTKQDDQLFTQAEQWIQRFQKLL